MGLADEDEDSKISPRSSHCSVEREELDGFLQIQAQLVSSSLKINSDRVHSVCSSRDQRKLKVDLHRNPKAVLFKANKLIPAVSL